MHPLPAELVLLDLPGPSASFSEGRPEGNLPLGRLAGNVSSFPSCPVEAD